MFEFLKNNIKNIFYCIATIAISLLIIEKLHVLYTVQSKEYKLEQQQKEYNQRVIQKRKKMDNQYIFDFKRVYLTYLNSRQLWVQDCQLSNTIKNLEDKMIHDGYNYAEISEIKLIGENKARASYQ